MVGRVYDPTEAADPVADIIGFQGVVVVFIDCTVVGFSWPVSVSNKNEINFVLFIGLKECIPYLHRACTHVNNLLSYRFATKNHCI